jgi:hypothetical protein
MKTSAKRKVGRRPRRSEEPRRVARHRYQWVIDSLYDEPSFFQRPMFGARACYLHGKLVLALMGQSEEPWCGILVATERSHHKSLIKEFSALRPHSVLGKWLYLPETAASFEETANGLVERILAADSRIGVETGRQRRLKI